MALSYGPGVLRIGETGSAFDASCLVNGLIIEPSVDRADSTKKLCGIERPGVATYTAVMTGNIDSDAEDASGLFKLSWANAGSVQDFEFAPNNDGPTATGQLIIDPMSYGADAFGDDLASDISWTIFGDITMTPIDGEPYVLRLGAVAPAEGGGTVQNATGAVAGTPGYWTPLGATPPGSVAELQASGIIASPATAWTSGQYVATGSGNAHWDGDSWETGAAV